MWPPEALEFLHELEHNNEDHPRIGRLRLKRLALYRRHPLRRWLHTRSCDRRVQTELEAARPFVTWLNEHVGPSTRPRPR